MILISETQQFDTVVCRDTYEIFKTNIGTEYALKIIGFIICDDIRQEVGSKVTLVGVYDNAIVFTPPPGKQNVSWPISMKLGFFLKILREEGDHVQANEFELVISRNGEEVLHKVNGRIENLLDKKIVTLYFVIPAFRLTGPGEMTVEVLFKGRDDDPLRISPDTGMKIVEASGSRPVVH